MECKCGGYTLDHDVIRQGKIVSTYAKCVACGRIIPLTGIWPPPAINREKANKQSHNQRELQRMREKLR